MILTPKAGGADNAEESFKCCQCGHMFGTEGRRHAECPVCGHDCAPPHCGIVDASNEGY